MFPGNKISNSSITANFSRMKVVQVLLPLIFLTVVGFWLYIQHAFNEKGYIDCQKGLFLFINHQLGSYPRFELNVTQLGDAMVLLSLLSLTFLSAPKIWEVLQASLLVSLLFSRLFKTLFHMPRPAAVIDNHEMIILGQKLSGHSSLPSGHSITVFTILTVVMYAFLPQNFKLKILWVPFMLMLGLIVASSRIGVGAHFPMDVVVGCIIGYLCGVLGILIGNRYRFGAWVGSRKFFPVIILLFLAFAFFLVQKIIAQNLLIYYLALGCLLFSLYKIYAAYAKK